MRRGLRFRLLLNAAVAGCLLVIAFAASGLTQGEMLCLHALRHLEAPYVFGATGPDSFDCSGLVLHCMRREGVSLPRTAVEMGADRRFRQIMDPGRLMVGDLVCFDTVRDSDPSDHVGFYMGGGQFVHASSAKGKVIVSDLDGFYLEKFTGARRAAQVWF